MVRVGRRAATVNSVGQAGGQLLARGAAPKTSVGSGSSAVQPDELADTFFAHACKKRSLVEGAPRRLNTRRRCGGPSVTSSDSADCGRIASPAGAVRRTATNKTYPNDMEFTCEASVRTERLGMKSADRGALDMDENTCPLFMIVLKSIRRPIDGINIDCQTNK